MILLTQKITLKDPSSAGEARRAAQAMAESIGLDDVKTGETAIIVTEAARNAVLHGGGGELLLSGSTQGQAKTLDIVAIDKGPGITDLSRAMSDGYSTNGTPGTGLGAIRRLAQVSDIFSNSRGTAVFARVEETSDRAGLLDVAGFTIPIDGERVCGDGMAWVESRDRFAVILADGLGHGPLAAEAANEAAKIFRAHSTLPPGQILARVHDALKKTRGAAVAIAEIRPLSGTVVYAGVGNITGVVMSAGNLGRNLVSHNGTVGHIVPRIQEFTSEWPRDGRLIMFSDGLLSKWNISTYPGLTNRPAAVIAAILLRDFRRGRDDSSVFVLQHREGRP
jgi:anti-sigma regulatory factor (Ser/Thr protein kinase)